MSHLGHGKCPEDAAEPDLRGAHAALPRSRKKGFVCVKAFTNSKGCDGKGLIKNATMDRSDQRGGVFVPFSAKRAQ